MFYRHTMGLFYAMSMFIAMALGHVSLEEHCPTCAATEDVDVAASNFHLLQTKSVLQGHPAATEEVPSAIFNLPPLENHPAALDEYCKSSTFQGCIFPGESGFGYSMKQLSMQEASLTCSNVSFYGAAVPKVAESFVTSTAELKRTYTTKTHMYNFQGSIYSGNVAEQRQWVFDFVGSEFTDTDFFKATDATSDHTPLGPYDHSNEAGFRPKDNPKFGILDLEFDTDYYQTMVQSTFTLCPAGDRPWSLRFYEAIMAGSIPVIHSKSADFNTYNTPFWMDHIGYTYFTDEQVVNMKMSAAELEHIADENYKLFEKYQTFTHGDHVPVAYDEYKNTCFSYEVCKSGCLMV